mmetsp:Transcript_54027/g.135839  ORF Transcript_54027/g.135839 Transcript_54027/m.135839 type:complete len:204 (+) Transcript_54027:1864-2475(+)
MTSATLFLSADGESMASKPTKFSMSRSASAILSRLIFLGSLIFLSACRNFFSSSVFLGFFSSPPPPFAPHLARALLCLSAYSVSDASSFSSSSQSDSSSLSDSSSSSSSLSLPALAPPPSSSLLSSDSSDSSDSLSSSSSSPPSSSSSYTSGSILQWSMSSRNSSLPLRTLLLSVLKAMALLLLSFLKATRSAYVVDMNSSSS